MNNLTFWYMLCFGINSVIFWNQLWYILVKAVTSLRQCQLLFPFKQCNILGLIMSCLCMRNVVFDINGVTFVPCQIQAQPILAPPLLSCAILFTSVS